ncbi:ATP-dependent RNA helicase DEAH13 [Quillaja saponaria]|uniref:RNA helicase n=1 Tax=Quillaja saponaria TaxID=32244 RepID=A0AAD7LRM2_QUISA|nr:ATP-dependent RNA helicase DEAH13 [Quillaja saponaria]
MATPQLQLLDSGNHIASLEDGDSNAIMLPGKKNKKRKGLNQKHGEVKSNKKQKLSKSQKRKIKKLEEEKEKELLLSNSIETLNKYKIPEYAYPLLQSSRNINQAESMLEKRRRAAHLLKEGLELPHGYEPFSKSDELCGVEPESEVIHSGLEIRGNRILPLTITQTEVSIVTSVSLDYSQRSVLSNGVETDSGSLAASQAEVSTEKMTSMANDETENTNLVDKAEESLKANLSQISKPQDASVERILTTPTVVHVFRPAEVEEKRKDLPIVMMEQEIMEAINEHSIVILCGETGCGKTTQVPQFLYEAGFGSSKSRVHSGIIGVTQPRRVAVLATAKRVAYELGLHLGKEVGFQVRYDKRIGDNCSIKFMTDGILLKEVQNDILLSRYSVIILDEAHERSLNTDILIGMLSRVIKLRQVHYDQQQQKLQSGESISPECMIFPLKLVLMSATLRVEDFISQRLFFTQPPVIEVPTRQFPVTVHFSKKTEIVDYVGQAYKKVLAIHKRLPHGGILVFVTGQREVEYLCKKLRRASRDLILKNSKRTIENDGTMISEAKTIEGINMTEINEAFEVHGNSAHQQTDRFSSYDEGYSDEHEDKSDVSYDSETESELEVSGDDLELFHHEHQEKNDNLVLGEDGTLASLKASFEALSGKTELNSNIDEKQTPPPSTEECLEQSKTCTEKSIRGDSGSCPGGLYVLPLYAMLPAAAQLRVFEEVKEGERLVVVATNVAETSLTIPGIKYVVDTGREKVKNYNSSNGMETYEVQWISKASAAQRAGRAGRTGPGHCYRLYSSAVFTNVLPGFSLAEISKVPVEGVVLLLKSMRIKKVVNFPFPTPPKDAALVEAENCLKALEALDSHGELTLVGKAMAQYPLSPRHSRMLLTVIKTIRHELNCSRASLILAYTVAAAAALSLSNPFLMEFEGSNTNSNESRVHEESSVRDNEKVRDKQEKIRKKKLKETAKVARKKFRNLTSDALTVAYALQCFECSQSPVEFCNSYALHLKTMEEMSKLKQQLLKLVFYHSVGGVEQYSWHHGNLEDVEHAWRASSEKYPLSLDEEVLIRQAICAGWADRIAKRITVTSRSSDGDIKARAVRYQSCMVEEIVFLHRWSSVSIAAPEFLVYNELLQTKRPYMHGVTSVEASWLVDYARSSCTFSAPLTDPKPFYDAQTDQVKCWVVPTFGRFSWELPKHALPIIDVEHRAQVFAYAFLEGQVCPCLKSAREFMAAPPESILKREALGQKRVGNLLSKLKVESIDSRAKLTMAWKKNPWVLYSEVLDWFQKSFQKHFRERFWLPMHGEVFIEPQQTFSPKVKRQLKGKAKLPR